MLNIQNLKVTAKENIILDDFNLQVDDDEIVAIMGPNGAGKSSLCKAIFNDKNYKKEGKILFDSNDTTNLTTSEISKLGIYYVMQNPIELKGITNAELIRAALNERGVDESIFAFNKRMEEICLKLHIEKEYIHKEVNYNLSGGEKKKNELLILYALKPKLILLDELDSGLDIDSLKTLSSALYEYKKESKCSILIITHHINILEYLKPDKVLLLSDKKIIKKGDYELAKEIEKNGFRANNIKEEGKNE